MSKTDKLNEAISYIEKTFGKGSIMKLGDAPEVKMDVISTSCLSLDIALGVGGIPKGRIVEIYGPESSGKTTLCLHIISEAQKKGDVAAFIDTEHAFDINYAKKLGVDVENLYMSQPDCGEDALEIVDKLVESESFGVIVVDSVAALTPRAEIEGEMGDSHMGLQARLMSQALRKLNGPVNKNNITLIFTNQLRDKIGVMFGPTETTTGGKSLKFYASIRLDIRRLSQIKSGTDVIGNRTKVKVVKNKVASPFKEVEFDIIYNEGISKIGDLIDVAINLDIIKKSGAWFTLKNQRVQGREGLKQILLENTELFSELNTEVRTLLKL